MEINALTSLQNRLEDVRSRVATRQNPAVDNVDGSDITVNLSGHKQVSGNMKNIDPEQASEILNEVQMSASSNDSFGNVHNLDINRVLQLIS